MEALKDFPAPSRVICTDSSDFFKVRLLRKLCMLEKKESDMRPVILLL